MQPVYSRGPLVALAALSLFFTVNCGDDLSDDPEDQEELSEAAIMPRFEPEADDFFRMPWPSDARLTETGAIDGSDFPNKERGFIAKYVEEFQDIEGYSNMPVLYVNLDIDDAAAATEDSVEEFAASFERSFPAPADTIQASSPVQLVDVSDQGCGERVPVEVAFDAEGDSFMAPNTLQAAPLPGYALAPRRTYAFVVLKSLGEDIGAETAAPPNFDGLLAADAPSGALADSYAPLRECLSAAELAASDIAVATVFTTQEPVAQTRALRDKVRDPATPDPEITSWAEWTEKSVAGEYIVWKGTMEMPIFQVGTAPYSDEGGLEFDEAGEPVIQRWEEIPFAVTFPANPSGPVGILIWEDGTGANLESHIGDAHIVGTVRGGNFAVATFPPQFHDARATNTSDELLSTFNYLNPAAGRTVFRQQAAETSYFLRMVKDVLPSQPGVPEMETERAFYGGHSQGALVGALVAAVEPDFDAFLFNGVGGYFTNALIWRTEPFDVAALVQRTLQIDRDIDRFHLVSQMAQLGADVVDPANYARYWRGWEAAPGGASVFMINGRNDTTTSTTAMNALTLAADAPVVGAAGWEIDPWGLGGISTADLPVEGNTTALDGSPLTIGSYFNRNTGHFTIYRNQTLMTMALRFWRTAREDGTPRISF